MSQVEDMLAGRVVRRGDGTDRIDVTGPAVVATAAGNDYEIATAMTLPFPADSHVWVKVWPEEAK